MRRTGIRFIWVTGSLSSNAIKVLKQRNIAFEYDHFGKLTADFYGIGIFEKIDFEHVKEDEFEICRNAPPRRLRGQKG